MTSACKTQQFYIEVSSQKPENHVFDVMTLTIKLDQEFIMASSHANFRICMLNGSAVCWFAHKRTHRQVETILLPQPLTRGKYNYIFSVNQWCANPNPDLIKIYLFHCACWAVGT